MDLYRAAIDRVAKESEGYFLSFYEVLRTPLFDKKNGWEITIG